MYVHGQHVCFDARTPTGLEHCGLPRPRQFFLAFRSLARCDVLAEVTMGVAPVSAIPEGLFTGARQCCSTWKAPYIPENSMRIVHSKNLTPAWVRTMSAAARLGIKWTYVEEDAQAPVPEPSLC